MGRRAMHRSLQWVVSGNGVCTKCSGNQEGSLWQVDPAEVTLHPSNMRFSTVCPRVGGSPTVYSPKVNQIRSTLCSEKAYFRVQKKTLRSIYWARETKTSQYRENGTSHSLQCGRSRDMKELARDLFGLSQPSMHSEEREDEVEGQDRCPVLHSPVDHPCWGRGHMGRSQSSLSWGSGDLIRCTPFFLEKSFLQLGGY